LAKKTRISLPATLLFDYPSAAAVGDYLLAQIAPTDAPRPPIEDGLDRVEAMLRDLDAAGRAQIELRLQAFHRQVGAVLAAADGTERTDDLGAISDEEMFELIDKEFGGA